MSNSFMQFLDHWWNLPFLVMLLVVAAYFAMQLLGLVGHVAHVGHHAHGHGRHHGRGGRHGKGGKLAFVDRLTRRAPFAVVWLSVCVFGGFTGLIVNRVVWLETGGVAPAWLFPVSLAAAAVVAIAGVTIAGRLASKLVPPDDERGSTSRRELVGTAGTVASPALDARYGEVRVSDGKQEMLVHARVHDGDATLAHGDRVVLVELDDESGFYWVTALPDAAA